MRIVLDGDIGEEDLVLFARFLREMWRNRKDNLFVNIEHGMEHISKGECMEMFEKIFTMNDKDWTKCEVSKKMYDKFVEKMKK